VSDTDPLLEVEGLQKYYYEQDTILDRLLGRDPVSVKAVDGVDFHIREGETLGLVGESGCGKSTTGETLLRLREPTDGRVTFDGEDVLAMGDDQLAEFRRRAQIVFQDPFSSLDPRMTAGEVVTEGLEIWIPSATSLVSHSTFTTSPRARSETSELRNCLTLLVSTAATTTGIHTSSPAASASESASRGRSLSNRSSSSSTSR